MTSERFIRQSRESREKGQIVYAGVLYQTSVNDWWMFRRRRVRRRLTKGNRPPGLCFHPCGKSDHGEMECSQNGSKNNKLSSHNFCMFSKSYEYDNMKPVSGIVKMLVTYILRPVGAGCLKKTVTGSAFLEVPQEHYVGNENVHTVHIKNNIEHAYSIWGAACTCMSEIKATSSKNEYVWVCSR